MEIKPLDLSRDDICDRAMEIHRAAFPGVRDLDKQLLHNSRNAPSGSIFFGAFENDRLIGLNGFVRHSVATAAGRDAVFQSCSTATDPAFRGRGVFTSIIRHAQTALRAAGLSIVGFPNENSGPIFVGPLGFAKVPLIQVFVPGALMPLVCSRWLRLTSMGDAVRFDQDELLTWKKRAGAPVEVHDFGPVRIWGRRYQMARAGLPLMFMSAGGIHAVGPSETSAKTAAPRLLGRPAAYVFLTTAGSALDRAAGIAALRRSGSIFIHFPLRAGSENAEFEICAGLADFY